MKRMIALLTTALLALSMMGTAAMADTDLWDDDDVLDSDSETTTVEEAPQEASVSLEGPSGLDVDEVGTYTVEVTNDSDQRDLDQWVLGLSVDNIGDVDDLTISYPDSSDDITEGTSGVEVELDEEANIIYLRGSDDPAVSPGETETQTFEAAFHNEGEFTGTAYVIDTSDEEAATGAITGAVTDPDGDGIDGATVEADGPIETSTETDADGTYELSGLEDGTYDLFVTSDGGTGSDTVTVEDGETITDVNFTLAG